MPSEIMDQRRFCMPSEPTSFFSEEIRFPTERHVGFRKPESVPDHRGTEGMSFMLANKSVSSSSFGRNPPGAVHSVERIEFSQPGIVENHKTKFSHGHHSLGTETSAGLSMASWRADEENLGLRSGLYVPPASRFPGGDKVDLSNHNKNGLFASALTDIFDKKLILSSKGPFGQSVHTVHSNFAGDELFQSLEEIEAHTIGDLLPDDNDLLSGLIDNLDYNARPNNKDDVDDDLFYSGGGIELEADDNLNCNKDHDFFTEVSSNCHQGLLNNSFGGEQSYGEHLSRTLFVRNINSNVEDAELRVLFEQYGDIHTLYTACKHRGFIVISYYDLRAAVNARTDLQNMPLRHGKLDIHFSIPKGNPFEKGINQGMLVLFNIDSSVSNDDLRQIFGVYGEIKEIHETPQKRGHKFIEYYDVRAADAALRALNRSDTAGKKIKLEPGLSSSARWCVMPRLSLELGQEESAGCGQRSPSNDSPSVFYGSFPLGGITSSGLDSGASQGLPSAVQELPSPFMETAFHGISSRVPNNSSPSMVTSVVNHNSQSSHFDPSHSLGHLNVGFRSLPSHPHSLPESHGDITNSISYNNPNTMSSMGFNLNSRRAEGIDWRHSHRVGSGVVHGHSFEEGALGLMGNGSYPRHGHQYILNNSNSYHHHPHAPMIYSSSPSFMNNIPGHACPQMHGLGRSPSHILNSVLPLHYHHVGSAPAVNTSLWDRRNIYAADSAEAPCFHPGSLGSMQLPCSSQLHPLELASHNIFPHAGVNCISPSHGGIRSPQQRPPLLPSDRIRNRKSDACANHADNKKQYELDIDRIVRGEDSRTTLMIKNIPNKYTSKMLLATIDEHHRGSFNFIYLPIDFKNKCNVGYAFINMIDPQQIIPFYQAFHGKKWEKFNSEKVASLAYARIQGKAALIAHFQNSSLMNEDKRCRPVLFHTDGPNAGDQEPFPVGPNIRSRPGRSRTVCKEENHQGSPPSSANGEESSNGTYSSSSSTKDSE